MKVTKYLGISLISLMLLGGATIVQAADEATEESTETPVNDDKNKIVNMGEKETKTKIIIEGYKPGDEDKLDPKDPKQTSLNLLKVPTIYEFKSRKVFQEYKITSETIGDASVTNDDVIDVYNDHPGRGWKVVATLGEKISGGSHVFDVTRFAIDGVELTATGKEGVVSETVSKTVDKNLGIISKKVEKVEIDFTDIKSELKPGDALEGKIEYQLYNTPVSP